MEPRIEENPWKHKGRLEYIGYADVFLAIVGITYGSYRMFTFFWDIEGQEVANFMKGPVHIPFYFSIWVVVVLFYIFQIGISYVLYSAVNQEATETDPYVSIQKCHCWLRCSRVVLFFVVVKLCLQPVIIFAGNIHSGYGFYLGIAELIFRTAAIFGVKKFIQELQT